MTQSNRVLVMGSGGRLGRLLRAAKKRDRVQHVEMVFQSSGSEADIRWKAGDALDKLPTATTVIGLWGVTSGNETALRGNTELAQLTLHVANAVGASLAIHISTAGVYGPGRMMGEDHPLMPVSCYGHSKIDMETWINEQPEHTELTNITLRVANVVGADSLAPGLMSDKPIAVDRFADGAGPQRSYVAAGDLFDVFCRLSQMSPKTIPPLLNIAAPNPVAMEDLAHAARKKLIWRDAPRNAVQTVSLDVSALRKLLPEACSRTTAAQMIDDWRELEALT